MSAPILKLRVTPKFKAALFDGTGTKARKDGLASYVDLDFSALTHLGSYDPSTQLLIAQSTIDGTFGTVTIAQVISGAQTEQDIIAGAVVNVAVNDGMIKIAKTVGSATQVILPPASTKVGPVTISDFKGDAGTNNITVTLSGSDKFPGNLTSWVIAGDGASITAKPLKDGSGYAI